MKDILIIAHFTQVPGEAGNGRFNYIAEKLCEQNAVVEIITSSFSHRTKEQRTVTNEQLKGIKYKLTMIYEPGYKKNVSLTRFYSHYKMSLSLSKYLKSRKKPDVIYCAVPSLDVAQKVANYAKRNKIKLILDIQDLWPEAFSMMLQNKFISRMLFYPLKKQADYIYKTADEVVAVSKTYVERAMKANNKLKKACSVYLGTDLNLFDELAIKGNKNRNDEIILVYIGTLGNSYDLNYVIDALKVLKSKSEISIRFLVMGDGPLKSKFESYAKRQGINAQFTGRLDYPNMVGLLADSDIAINPIRPGSAGSIINKVGDYAAAGLPVINTQDSKEYKDLVTSYKAGLNCSNQNVKELSDTILAMCESEEMRMTMGKNNRKLAEDLFDRQKTYNRIVEMILG